MIELLILYILNNREKTVYAIRQEIIEKFGAFTKPSLGTIHPALKRLLLRNAVSVRTIITDGGKKKTFYDLTKTSKEVFRELFFKDFNENPSSFYLQFQSRIVTLSMLDEDDKKIFFEKMLNKIELQKYAVKNIQENKYITLDEYQNKLLNLLHDELCSTEKFIGEIK